MEHGAALAADCAGRQCVGFGEMGIGNTTSAAALMHKLTGLPAGRLRRRRHRPVADGVLHKQRVIEAPRIAMHTRA
jgi:nicotinate-nucleotide--dimethylbenzimidazole phosphoribosyltransferase